MSGFVLKLVNNELQPLERFPSWHEGAAQELIDAKQKQQGGVTNTALWLLKDPLHRAWFKTLIAICVERAQLHAAFDANVFVNLATRPWTIETPFLDTNLYRFEMYCKARAGGPSIFRPAVLSLAFAAMLVGRCLGKGAGTARPPEKFAENQDKFYKAFTKVWGAAPLANKYEFYREIERLVKKFEDDFLLAADLKNWDIDHFHRLLTEHHPSLPLPEPTAADLDGITYPRRYSVYGKRETRSASPEPVHVPWDNEREMMEHLRSAEHALGHPRISHRSAAHYFPQDGYDAKRRWERAQRAF
ncbi:hypothetical protein JCM10207_005573 [Rhodosporidiobolus poonsookiae]